jgi:hypothetical protein
MLNSRARYARFLLNGLLLAGALVAGAMRGEGSAAPVVANQSKIAQLEKSVGSDPTEPELATLAQGYLEQKQPGLALGLLERPQTPHSPTLDHLRAAAYVAQGEAFRALELSRSVGDRCELEACPAWVVAKAAQQTAFLDALLERGVVDPAHDPEATAWALERSRASVQLVAVR